MGSITSHISDLEEEANDRRDSLYTSDDTSDIPYSVSYQMDLEEMIKEVEESIKKLKAHVRKGR